MANTLTHHYRATIRRTTFCDYRWEVYCDDTSLAWHIVKSGTAWTFKSAMRRIRKEIPVSLIVERS